jgi:hypothetical protein
LQTEKADARIEIERRPALGPADRRLDQLFDEQAIDLKEGADAELIPHSGDDLMRGAERIVFRQSPLLRRWPAVTITPSSPAVR